MKKAEVSREKTIVRTSIIGIIANVFLAGFKAVIGLMANSIAIVLDAVNNISDAGSSLITIVGTKLAGKEPEKKHPFGYGRIEYLSAMIISVIVLYAGITSFVESVKQIIHPETPDYSTIYYFYMTSADREFAIGYYYDAVAKLHGISREEFRQTLDYFLFYEYCEWVMLGNRYNGRDDERYAYYLNLAEQLAEKLV